MTPPTPRQHALAYIAAVCNISVLIAIVVVLPWWLLVVWVAVIAGFYALRLMLDRVPVGPRADLNQVAHKERMQ